MQNKEWHNKNKWTPLRKAQYKYFKEHTPVAIKGVKLLDIGAGAGQFHDLYVGYDVDAIDFEQYTPSTILHDLETPLPFVDETYKVVTSSNTFEHIHDYKELLSECHRLLASDGVLVASTPFMLGVHQAPHDYHRYTKFEIERTLTEIGFVDVEVVPLSTAYEWYMTSKLHFFMPLFDATEHKPISRLVVKLIWNLYKIIDLVAAPLYRMNTTSENTLGYGFVGRKK